MAKRLKVPASYGTGMARMFSLSGGHKQDGRPQQFRIARAHEAWRYGLGVVTTHQTDLEASLVNLMQWIEADI